MVTVCVTVAGGAETVTVTGGGVLVTVAVMMSVTTAGMLITADEEVLAG